jgi:hypothetical protein
MRAARPACAWPARRPKRHDPATPRPRPHGHRARMTQAEHPTSLAALRSRYGVRYRWLLLLAVMVGTMASIMSSTIVNVAIPDMSQHFALGQERAQWVTSGLHGGDDGLDAHHALAAGALRLPPHLHRLHVAAAGRRRGRRLCTALPAGAGRARRSRGWPPAWCSPFRPSSSCAPSSPTSRAAPAASSAWAWCWRRRWGRQHRRSAGGVPSAGARSSSWSMPFCLASLWLATALRARSPPPAAPPPSREGAALDWRRPGLLGFGRARCACSTAWSMLQRRHAPLAARQRCSPRPRLALAWASWRLQRRMLLARRRHRDQGVDPLMNLARCSAWRPFAMGSIVALHLRHRPVRLHLPAAGVHADGAGSVGRRTSAPSCCRPAWCWAVTIALVGAALGGPACRRAGWSRSGWRC